MPYCHRHSARAISLHSYVFCTEILSEIDLHSYIYPVIRASVPKLNLDDVFEQKNEIAKAVEDELEKVNSF